MGAEELSRMSIVSMPQILICFQVQENFVYAGTLFVATKGFFEFNTRLNAPADIQHHCVEDNGCSCYCIYNLVLSLFRIVLRKCTMQSNLILVDTINRPNNGACPR